MAERRQSTLWPYVQIMRVDHWFKNAFMLLGVLLAFFYDPQLLTAQTLEILVWAFFTTCIIASSNYVLNEWLDAPLDRLHPTKCERPAARGLISTPGAIIEWLSLGALGVSMAFMIGPAFGYSGLALWVMGCIYNIPPVRSKDVPYIDVISESVNNPIRLLLGWYALVDHLWPPLSLVIAYWMVGAFFMATKRFAEYRHIGDPVRAAKYRKSFAHYTEERLVGSMVFYLSACALFSGVFIVRYKLELILCAPVVAGFFAYYVILGMREDSPVQNPEKLYKQRGFFAYALFTTALFVITMFLEFPALYEWFNYEPSSFEPLWKIGI